MTKRKMHTILFDCERMKYPHTGLYHFCFNLGKSLLKAKPVPEQFCFYVPPSVRDIFGKDVHYIRQHSLHKFLRRNYKVALWHSTWQKSMYLPKRGTKFLLTVHDLNFLYESGKTLRKKKEYLQSIQRRIDRADHIVAISHFALKDFRQNLNLENKSCEVIYNGCSIEEIPQLQKPAIAPSAPFLFTIGTMIDKKNFHVLPCLLARNNMHLIIAGITHSDAYKHKIIEEAKKWNVANRVIFTGPISENDKQWYYKECAAFVFPSISEGFGLPVVEAMHFGKPVILSTSTSLPEIGGEVAYYFNSFDPEEMDHVLSCALNQHSTEKAEKIKKWAEQFNWDTSARQYSALYTKLLG